VSFEKIQGCGGGIPRSIRLSQAQRELPAQLSAHITENFSIQGVAAMTPTMFQAMLTEAFAKLGTVPPCGGNASASTAGAMFHLWADGMYHELPADFEITTCSCKLVLAWQCWRRSHCLQTIEVSYAAQEIRWSKDIIEQDALRCQKNYERLRQE
jgi:hypothetical protein